MQTSSVGNLNAFGNSRRSVHRQCLKTEARKDLESDKLKTMLALFNNSFAHGPAELVVPHAQDSRHWSGTGTEVLARFKAEHPLAITMQFDDISAMAFSHHGQGLVRPRSLSVVDDMFCMFQGNLENWPQLRQQYGLSRSAKTANETSVVIEMYRSLRDRAPYPADQAVRALQGSFVFVLFDSTTRRIFAAADAYGKVPIFWGTTGDGALAFSDNLSLLKEGCGKSCSPFPQGCFFTSLGGLHSFEHPLKSLKPVPRVDSMGQMCGALFQVELEAAPRFPRVGSGASWATAF